MPECPVCRTEYPKHQIEFCKVCGWDLQPYSFVTGLIPEVIEKEKIRLDWAKKIWTLAQQRQQQLAQLDQQFKPAEPTALTVPPANPDIKPALFVTTANAETDQGKRAQINPTNPTDLSHSPAQPPLSTPLPKPLKPKPASALPLTLEQLDAVEQKAPEPSLTQASAASSTQFPTDLNSQLESVLELERSQLDQPLVKILSPNPEEFSFSVLTVDDQGQTLSRETHQALCFSEVLDQIVRLELVSIPGGCFTMGSPPDEFERDTNEQLQSNVCLPPFWLGKFPITQAQWRVVAELPRVNRLLNPHPASFEGENRPVEQVTWNDAIEFCDRLAHFTNRPYRLPTEVEWEYACRAGTTTSFHFGETLTSKLANYDGKYTYRLEPPGDYREGTTPVGLFTVANGFGLCDMHGNVWEWCADAWIDNRATAPIAGQGLDHAERLLRGGAWYCLPGLCRSAQRHWNQTNYGGSGIGFRVACSDLF
ncbi:MAG: formylglycine-generating enzyme family protein [Aphanocapsa sp. GSE-SYN-MK-11-07L]|jgi:formylglycine-generating enzyme required for sulfatase activity|nr:formylglycine-generating enzyme family protein [Aphanocapsa sp. GSE-SYN-MK-11-07L]